MTEVVIFKNKSGAYKGFKCLGHAGYNAKTNDKYDLVCASVSVLIINTINCLEDLAKEVFTVKSDENAGLIECSFNTLQDHSVFLLDSMVYGLNAISNQYGKKYLQVRIEEV